MKIKIKPPRSLATFALGTLTLAGLHAEVPETVHYQGQVTVASEAFNGTGQFKFSVVDDGTENVSTATATANVRSGSVDTITMTDFGNGYTTVPDVTLSGGSGKGATATATLLNGQVSAITVDTAGSGYESAAPTVVIGSPPPATIQTLWSNDGSSSAGSAPTAAVSLPVSGGVFSVILGDAELPGMTALPAATFASPPVRLRVWFSSGSGFEQLTPDQPITSTPYAMQAEMAAGVADGAIGAEQLNPDFALWSSTDGKTWVDQFVGIGTNDPQAPLQVIGSVISGEPGNAASGLNSFVSGGVVFEFAGTVFNQINVASGDYAFVGGGTFNTASGGGSFVGGGLNNQAVGYSSFVGGGGINRAIGDYSFVGGGRTNQALGSDSFVGGGEANQALELHSFIGGGELNAASGVGAFVGGGRGNSANEYLSFVGGGAENAASGSRAFVGGGLGNTASGASSFVSGGTYNSASKSSTFIGGGGANVASGDHAAIAGGFQNRANGVRSFVGGGQDNDAMGLSAFIGGGRDNNASGLLSFIGAGANNTTNAEHSFIGGGTGNNAGGLRSFVGGGINNNAGGNDSFIGGGQNNISSEIGTFVAGGFNNTASGRVAFVSGDTNVAGGFASFIAGGQFNTAGGFAAFVGGGGSNAATGIRSFAAGTGAKAVHDGSFVWADNISGDFSSVRANQFKVRANGGAEFQTGTRGMTVFSNASGTAGAAVQAESTITNGIALVGRNNSTDATLVLTNRGTGSIIKAFNASTLRMQLSSNGNLFIGGSLSQSSDERLKRDVERLDGVLDDVLSLQPASYRMKDRGEDSDRLYGFIAQEVREVFPMVVGEDAESGLLSLSYSDFSVLAIQAIKEQQEIIDSQAERIAALEAAAFQNKQFEARLVALESRLADEPVAAR